MFTLLTRLLHPEPNPAQPPPPPQPQPQPQQPLPPRHPPHHPPPAAETGDDPQQGCGWFDSSHELMHGVTVWEGIVVVDNAVAKH
ncbi:MAG: hypothetical protein KA711_05365 [Ideonella sp. WA131b]|jgi:hypothetical protein|nr:hypothetical protein [Ideonella sp. WA131b]